MMLGVLPYKSTGAIRNVSRTDLPSDLAQFYASHEGVGIESDPDQSIRVCKLREVAKVNGWGDLKYGLANDNPPGWSNFLAIRIGVGIHYEEILYVINAPICAAGSILAIGTGIIGPGGNGIGEVESALVLASSLSDWLDHLEQYEWSEPIIMSNKDCSQVEVDSLQAYYKSLNPHMQFD